MEGLLNVLINPLKMSPLFNESPPAFLGLCYPPLQPLNLDQCLFELSHQLAILPLLIVKLDYSNPSYLPHGLIEHLLQPIILLIVRLVLLQLSVLVADPQHLWLSSCEVLFEFGDALPLFADPIDLLLLALELPHDLLGELHPVAAAVWACWRRVMSHF